MSEAGTDYWDWLREDAAAFRKMEWEFRKFRSGPALFSRDGRMARSYEGGDYDPAEWVVREGGWDHEHCRFCMIHICDSVAEDHEHETEGYFAGGEALCIRCYNRIVRDGEDPEVVLRDAGWQ